jgi:hypothetical protein
MIELYKMALKKIIQREIEVAFAKHAQPVWFRILKYVLLAVMCYFFWEGRWFWIILIVLFVVSLCIHFWYRYKTNGWTKSYGGWNYEENKPKERD